MPWVMGLNYILQENHAVEDTYRIGEHPMEIEKSVLVRLIESSVVSIPREIGNRRVYLNRQGNILKMDYANAAVKKR